MTNKKETITKKLKELEIELIDYNGPEKEAVLDLTRNLADVIEKIATLKEAEKEVSLFKEETDLDVITITAISKLEEVLSEKKLAFSMQAMAKIDNPEARKLLNITGEDESVVEEFVNFLDEEDIKVPEVEELEVENIDVIKASKLTDERPRGGLYLPEYIKTLIKSINKPAIKKAWEYLNNDVEIVPPITREKEELIEALEISGPTTLPNETDITTQTKTDIFAELDALIASEDGTIAPFADEKEEVGIG